MKHIGDILPEAMDYPEQTQQDRSFEVCMVCGYRVEFVNEQYKKRCHGCGTMIQVKYRANKLNKVPKCLVCMDKGWAQYPVQLDGKVYNYAARCDCPVGMKLPSNILSLSQCKEAPGGEYLENRNRVALKINN